MLTLASHLGGSLLAHGNPGLIGQVPRMYRRYRARKEPSRQLGLRISVNGRPSSFLDGFLALEGQAQRVYLIRDMFLPRLLKWDDRNSMAFSVEGRYPFLDHELIELCLSFSFETLYSRGWTKWPLRLGLQGVLPDAVARRRTKVGFEVPQDKWLCGPLKPELERWLGQDRPVWELIERQDIQDLASKTWDLEGRRPEPGQTLLRAYLFDRWLELFGITA